MHTYTHSKSSITYLAINSFSKFLLSWSINHWVYMRCIDSVKYLCIEAVRPWGESGCGTVLVLRLYPTLTHDTKKFYVHCVSQTPVNVIYLPAKLCEGSCKGLNSNGNEKRLSTTYLWLLAIDQSPHLNVRGQWLCQWAEGIWYIDRGNFIFPSA